MSVIHHVALNDAGWWHRAMDRLVLAALWFGGRPLAMAEVLHCVEGELEVEVTPTEVEAALKRLADTGSVVQDSNARYLLTEGQRKEFQESVSSLAVSEQAVAARFIDAATANDIPHPESTWERFRLEALIPMIRSMGARIYEFVKATDRRFLEHEHVTTFLGLHRHVRTQLAKCIAEALDPNDDHVRNVILTYLSAYYCVSSARLDQATIDAVAARRKTRPRFRVLVDTNFLYSFLDLHDNPSNDAAARLRTLLEETRGKVDVKLYVFPPTVDETKTSLRSHRNKIRRLQTTPNIRRVIGEQTSGIAARFVQKTSGTTTINVVDEYFRPYLDDLLSVLKAKGIELFNEDPSHLSTDPEVIDDIHRWLEIEERRERNGERTRSYERVEHDVMLWHFANRKRGSRVESALDADVWVTTVDFRLLGFDEDKARRGHSLPVCLHPSNLVQMLQFWVPRSPTLERALVDSVRLPLLAVGFDADAERVTLDIINSLSRFENIGDLPDETVEAIVLDRALRAKMAEPHDESERVELVREALVAQNSKLTTRLQQTSQAATRTQEELAKIKSDLDERGETLAAEQEQRRELAIKIEAIQADLTKQVKATQIARKRGLYVAALAGGLVLVVVVVATILLVVSARFGVFDPVVTVAIAAFGVAVWLGTLLLVGWIVPELNDWRPIQRARKCLIAVLSMVVIGGVVALAHNLGFEWFKASFPSLLPPSVSGEPATSPDSDQGNVRSPERDDVE